MKMTMTDDEIRVSYNTAKSKVDQIQILADLNAVSKKQMITKLQELQLVSPDEVPKRVYHRAPKAEAQASAQKPDLKKALPKAQTMSPGALAGILQRLDEAYPGKEVEISVKDSVVTGALVTVRYGSDGSVQTVDMTLLTASQQ